MTVGFFSAHSDPCGSGGAERYLLAMMLGVRALAKAMAVGLPAITSNFGPLPEVNLHDTTGLVVSLVVRPEIPPDWPKQYGHSCKMIDDGLP